MLKKFGKIASIGTLGLLLVGCSSTTEEEPADGPDVEGEVEHTDDVSDVDVDFDKNELYDEDEDNTDDYSDIVEEEDEPVSESDNVEDEEDED